MKRLFPLYLFLLVLATGLHACAQDAKENKNEPKSQILFDAPVYDFGDIKQGDKVQHVFKFKNVGKAPLIITNVQTTCGCTVPEWPRDPIAIGKTGQITTTFNSAGKSGKQNKVITVVSNAANTHENITLTGNVLAPKNDGSDSNGEKK